VRWRPKVRRGLEANRQIGTQAHAWPPASVVGGQAPSAASAQCPSGAPARRLRLACHHDLSLRPAASACTPGFTGKEDLLRSGSLARRGAHLCQRFVSFSVAAGPNRRHRRLEVAFQEEAPAPIQLLRSRQALSLAREMHPDVRRRLHRHTPVARRLARKEHARPCGPSVD